MDAAASGRPFLGICVGMQLLYDALRGVARASTVSGILPGTVRRLPDGVKHPQMQWNQLGRGGGSRPLFAGLGERPWMYFVHSYAAEATDDVVATCDYGGPVTAAVQRGNVLRDAVPPREVRQRRLAVLANFVRLAADRRTAPVAA